MLESNPSGNRTRSRTATIFEVVAFCYVLLCGKSDKLKQSQRPVSHRLRNFCCLFPREGVTGIEQVRCAWTDNIIETQRIGVAPGHLPARSS